MLEKLSQAAISEARTIVCSAGLCETAVPVRLGDHLIGFLEIGQVFHHKPTPSQFERTAKVLAQQGVNLNQDKVKDAYFATRVMPEKQQESATTLLRIFAQHLHSAHALEHVKTLHGLLPICAWCKRVRDDKGYLEPGRSLHPRPH